MSKTTPTAFSALSSFPPKLHAIFEASLDTKTRRRKAFSCIHIGPVSGQPCANVLDVLRSQVAQSEQAKNLEQASSADDKLIKWLFPIVNVLSAPSSAISGAVGLVNPMIQMIILRPNLRSHI